MVRAKHESREVKAVYCQASVCETVEADRVTNPEFLELDVDILIPAALENQITAANAPRIRADIIVEIANGPTTLEADRLLGEMGKLVVPDILANCGGAIVSYFEWVQNRAGYYWDLAEVRNRLHAIMAREFNTVARVGKDEQVDLRTAAYSHALRRLDQAFQSKGTRAYFADRAE